jgi:hypothetical protein
LRRGRSSGVEHNLAKVGVEGSNPFARSNFRQWLKDDAQPRRLLSIVVYGRNGNRGYNLHKRAAASINCLAEMSRDSADELIFVDYNSPDGLSTFAGAIRDILTSRAKACCAFCGSDPSFTAGFSNARTSRCGSRWPGTSAYAPPTQQIAGYF